MFHVDPMARLHRALLHTAFLEMAVCNMFHVPNLTAIWVDQIDKRSMVESYVKLKISRT